MGQRGRDRGRVHLREIIAYSDFVLASTIARAENGNHLALKSIAYFDQLKLDETWIEDVTRPREDDQSCSVSTISDQVEERLQMCILYRRIISARARGEMYSTS